ncbi:MAG: guanylate kinase [Holosporaceae bacterium]|jgi:guanylate kinase|nr:guanylate kinase [Holosporaceae bacterium]
MRKGFLFVVSGPSGVGKTSVVDEILKIDDSLSKIITCTTRPMRSNEIPGIDYIFISREDFMNHIKNDDFVEFSEVYGNYYGILASSIFEKINAGCDIILIINWQGFLKIQKIFFHNVFGFFITPPSMEVLEQRIRSRKMDSEEVIINRLAMAEKDLSYRFCFQYIYQNDDMVETASDMLATINQIRGIN